MNITVLQDGSERIRYNNPGVPIYVCRGSLSGFSGMAALCHWHDDVEILLPLEGYLRYNVNGIDTDVREGQAIFVNSRMMHFDYSADGTDCRFLCIVFRPQMLSGNEDISQKFIRPILSEIQVPFLILENPEAIDQIRRVDSLYRTQPPGYELFALSALTALWREIYVMIQSMCLIPAPENKETAVVRKMLDYIRIHYAEQVTLKSIAASGGVCRTLCCRMFRKYLNRTPSNYLNSFRLEKSMEMLKFTDMPITEIAASCGFSNSSYFSKSFLQVKGCTPTQYRKI